MATVSYRVTKIGDQWKIARDGVPVDMAYLTQEAAFEVAFGDAAGDLRSGHDILIAVAAATEPSGARDSGGLPMKGDGFN